MRKRGWKKELTEQARQIMNQAALHERIDGKAHRFLRDLLENHPEAAAKIGCGVAYFVTRPNEWGKRTFWLVRHDGTETDFSFLACITPPTPYADFAKACREAVYPSVLEFKKSVLNRGVIPSCPITGENLGRENTHIDHAPPWTFDALVREFASQFEALEGLVAPTTDGEVVTRFLSPTTAEAFRVLHDGKAVLRAVSIRANLSVLRRSQ